MFDWDGTAVPDRDSDATEVRVLVEALCATAMHVAIVTGTHIDNVDDQLRARPRGPGRLLVAVNRGSEVFEVDEQGPRLLYRREASPAENAALDQAAAATIEQLAARGVEAALVSQRLNRRKIDVIPLPAWADPPKARIDELLAAVEARLAAAGIHGLLEVVSIAEAAARAAGLPDPRVTSDAKHVEIGLTDKSDAARDLFSRLWDEGIGPGLVLVGGDEFGLLGGLPGSDSLMLVPEARGVTCISVGVEPTGVPPGVIALGGGPARFLELLADQVRRRDNRDVPGIDARAGWTLSYAGIDHERERAVEAVLTLADGTIGTSGAPLLSHPSATPGVVIAGVYRGDDAAADLVDAPRWDRLGPAAVGDEQLSRTLDLHTGVLVEHVADTVQIDSVRFSSLARPGTAVLRVAAPNTMPGPALTTVDAESDTVHRDGATEWAVVRGKARAACVAATQDVREGIVDRVAAYEALDAPSGAHDGALARLVDARAAGFDHLLAEHRRAWAGRWAAADVGIAGDDDLQLATRVALFHLMASVATSGDATVGARGLSGHGYRGHVFWDSDVFVLPFLAATHPPAARAMLEYRVRRLDVAMEAALAEGRVGARFPWESATFGDDVTPRSVRDRSGHVTPIRTGWAEVHIVADIAWAAAHYIDWTADRAFAEDDGHRLFVETARYWTSRVRVDNDGAHLYGVIGPDEYHEPVDDNMFTNVMARWNLRRAAASAQRVGGIDAAEVTKWLDLADALVDGFDPATGVYEEFAGFHTLEPLLISEVARRPIVADLLLGRSRVRAAQVVKQADVLMAHHLVPDECEGGSLASNLDYYEPRTAHGSSLSPGVHAALLARVGRLDEALSWLRLAAQVDLTDVTQTTAGGLHLATMGSVWQALAWGFAGVRALPEALRVDPRLPDELDALELRVQYHGVPVRIEIGHEATTITATRPVPLVFGEAAVALVSGPDGVTVPNDNGRH